jgi:GNAT superfamily N-acetyltransferase
MSTWGRMEIELREVGPDDPGAQRLVLALRDEVVQRRARVDIDSDPREPPVAEVLAGDFLVLVAFDGDVPAGITALRDFTPGVAEVKRVYVEPGYRGAGVGRMLLEAAESVARERGLETLRLDTHDRLIEANRLYAAMGYREIEDYNGAPANRWYEKSLRELT